jgi:hypothetical protein
MPCPAFSEGEVLDFILLKRLNASTCQHGIVHVMIAHKRVYVYSGWFESKLGMYGKERIYMAFSMATAR